MTITKNAQALIYIAFGMCIVLIVMFFFRPLPESLKYLLNQGKYDLAIKDIKVTCAANKVDGET